MIKTAFVYGPFALLLLTLVTFLPRARLRIRAQAIWAMMLTACFSKFLIYRELGGDAFNPELPQLVIWLWNWAYSGAVILGLLSVPLAFFRVPRRTLLLPLVAWSLAAWGVWNGIRPPEIREIELPFENLPASLEGYRIVQLTDLHVSSAARRGRTERLVRAANACHGDLLVITGDFVDGLPRDREADVQPLAELVARDGVYAVTGNHEKYFSFAAWRPLFSRWGIAFLSNACVFPHPGLALGGLEDKAFGVQPSADRVFRAATNGEFRVLLQHRPSEAVENAQCGGVRLQLSGHTHGGICPLMANYIALYNGGFVRGRYDLGQTPSAILYVSPGAGQWAGFPIRFFNPPEITVFTLTRRTAHR